MSWPLEPPAFDDAGYEVVGGCLHPRIAMELFRLKERDPATMERCPCFAQFGAPQPPRGSPKMRR